MVKLDSKWLEDILKFLIGITLVILINHLAGKFFFRWDLTEENRYSISEATKDVLANLDDVVYVDVYLAGELPSGFKRFQKAIRETLDEFRVYADNKIQYKFIDPLTAVSQNARQQFMMRLNERGIQPTNVFANEDGQRIEKLIFPGALVYYGGQEKGVMLLKGIQGSTDLNKSIEGIEYELAATISQLSDYDKSRIALIGAGGSDSLYYAGLRQELNEFYLVSDLDLDNTSLTGFDAFILVQPQNEFSAPQKYALDQFLMNGGKGMFLMDAVKLDPDSIGGQGTLAIPFEANLDDMLFRYGVRINDQLVQDLNSASYPVVVGNVGDQPQIRPLPWPYFLLVNNYRDHPIVKNLDAIYLKYVSTLDTIKAEGVKKTPMFYSSQYSRLMDLPWLVSLNEIRTGLEPETFNQGTVPLAYLLEGSFQSLYRNRVLPSFAREASFKAMSEPTKIMICADGDLARNELNPENSRPYPLGFDPITRQTFANKDFILNSLAYLLEEQGIITARTKEVELRPLDKIKIQESRLQWQVLNLVVPVLLVILYGLIRYYLRKRKYSRF